MTTDFNLLNQILSCYNPSLFEHFVCSEFLKYLDRTSDSHIVVHGVNGSCEECDKDFGYPHRYTEKYIKGRFAKLYLLDDWYKQKVRSMTFLTMTSFHKADSMFTLENSLVNEIRDTFARLQRGKRLFMWELRNMGFKGVSYMMVVEPHQSGFPHYHMIIFASFTIDQQIRLKNCWEKWGIGSFEHGLDFDERPQKENIKSLRNYLMKYMSKSFVDYTSKYHESPWTKEKLLFNAIAWKYRYRTWCASNDLSDVMAYYPDKADNVYWFETTLSSETCDQHVLWEDEEKAEKLMSRVDGYLKHLDSLGSFRDLVVGNGALSKE
jgi:Bacteriophage replication gene A protein (GPA).